MVANNRGFSSDDYKYLSSGTYKNVFERRRGFVPKSHRKKKGESSKGKFVSAFFSKKLEADTEHKAAEIVSLIDPMHYFTIQPIDFVNLSKEPLQRNLEGYLKSQLPQNFRKLRTDPYTNEMVFPYGGKQYILEISQRQHFPFLDFLLPILFLIFWVGHMNESGYFHRDIKDLNILFHDSRLYLIDFGFLSNDFFAISGIEMHIDNPPEASYLAQLEERGSEDNYKQMVFTKKEFLEFVSQIRLDLALDILKYDNELIKQGRFFSARDRLDTAFKESLIRRKVAQDKIIKNCLQSHRREQNSYQKCRFPALTIFDDIFLLHGDKFDSYQLGCTIARWLSAYKSKFSHTLNPVESFTLQAFTLYVFEYLTVFNVTYRMNLSTFHKLFLKQLKLFEYIYILKEYQKYCTKVFANSETDLEANEQRKKAIKFEKKSFVEMLAYLEKLIR